VKFALTVPITGDVRPGFLHPELMPPAAVATIDADDTDQLTYIETVAMHLVDGVLGPHGILSHFPIVLIGVGGVGAVLHRHWPLPTKVLAMISLISAIVIVIVYVTSGANWEQPMFSVRWFIVFMPLLVYWCGAWLRKPHPVVMWIAAAVLLVFSMLTTILGATAPFTFSKDGQYTAYIAAKQLIKPPPVTQDGVMMAER
jgi:hypothetical protein